MSELVTIFQSSYLYEIEVAKTKLASREIPSYIKNEFVNNIAVFPISQNYYLMVSERDFEAAEKVLQENDEISEDDLNDSLL
ncbi:putative signal transducing protein [Kaistella sp.]|uniref:putative signal transducing protein n=1 Tax=Kaistella sp. TaxID=2782235 RepID=UPI003C4B7B99